MRYSRSIMAIHLETLPRDKQEYYAGFFEEAVHLNVFRRSFPETTRYSPNMAGASNKTVTNCLDDLFPLGAQEAPCGGDGEYRDWVWKTRDSIKILTFLTKIEPRLQLLRPQSEIILEFLRQRESVKRAAEGRSYIRPPQAEREAREGDLYDRFHDAKNASFSTLYLPSPIRLAGMFDASLGSMTISGTDREMVNGVEPQYRGTVYLNSFYQGMIRRLYQEYDCGSYMELEDRQSRWSISGVNTLNLLRKIEPHIVLRKRKVRFLIDFLTIQQFYEQNPYDDVVLDSQRTATLEGYRVGWQCLTD